jgi:hypothetical protein
MNGRKPQNDSTSRLEAEHGCLQICFNRMRLFFFSAACSMAAG